MPLASPTAAHWLDDDTHRSWLIEDASRQVAFFRASLRPDDGFYVLGPEGAPLPSEVQELHTTTRLVHSYALAKAAGFEGCDAIIDQGMRYLVSHHYDRQHGGYLWALEGDAVKDDRKLAYGHVFVLLAGSSAKLAGHPDADRLIADVTEVLNARFWEDGPGLFADEWSRDWTPFSDYRGMNANMHGVEALLAGYEATGDESYLTKAGRILTFFMRQMAPQYSWRLPEHYSEDWRVDPHYSENPMFRPAGTTPGHSFELARLMLQHWDLIGRPADDTLTIARNVIDRALRDAWIPEKGGLAYTMRFDGSVSIPDRYWWPVTEAIGAIATLLKIAPRPEDEDWYRRLWSFAETHFVDTQRGGWFPELDVNGQPTARQFLGKPDIYHALQADLIPLAKGTSRLFEGVAGAK